MAVEFPNTALEDVLELRGINQSYDKGKTHVIKDLNLLIENQPGKGQFVVILGQSGCGKSTLLRYLTGLQSPTSGQVLIHGKPRTEEIVISMVFQQYSSFPWRSVVENVMLPLEIRGLPLKERHVQAMAMIKTVGLEGHERKFAKIPNLSGGQLQRVAIARTLISNPDIILMDEPFGALDRYTRSQMQYFLTNLWLRQQSTVVFVTHDIPEAVFMADHIYIMRKNPGEIVKEFPVDLPFPRERSIKRDARFTNLVADIEDFIDDMAANSTTNPQV